MEVVAITDEKLGNRRDKTEAMLSGISAGDFPDRDQCRHLPALPAFLHLPGRAQGAADTFVKSRRPAFPGTPSFFRSPGEGTENGKGAAHSRSLQGVQLHMTSIDVFYQGEGIREIAHFEADPGSQLRRHQARDHREARPQGRDADLPRGPRRAGRRELPASRDHAGHAGIKAHLHRCRHVEVAVTFNGETVHHQFGPGTTVARVKTWAAERKFGMTPQEAGEHVLQITGTKDRPDPGTHLGAIAACPDCRSPSTSSRTSGSTAPRREHA